MTPEEQRVAIAEACGWTATVDDDQFWRATRADGSMTSDLWCSMSSVWNVGIPDYLNDLNAMHDAEKVLGILERGTYQNILGLACGGIREDDGGHFVSHRESIHATAAQRAEAFLRTIGKWRGAK
jgi:hypothetical protein